MRQEVIDIAWQVRYHAEAIADKEGRPENLNGLCAIASAELWRRLAKIGINATICMCEEDCGFHVFLKYDDHILCVTATQFWKFRDEPVLIKHEKEMEGEKFYRHPVFFRDASMLRSHQLNTGWQKDQVARK